LKTLNYNWLVSDPNKKFKISNRYLFFCDIYDSKEALHRFGF
jgi:hypothetical protein